jgi:hypothetical protein
MAHALRQDYSLSKTDYLPKNINTPVKIKAMAAPFLTTFGPLLHF